MLAAVASQARWKRKPTNSVTIRQSSNGLCDGHSTNEFVAHPEVCRSFYLCGEKGDAVLAFCPPTMLFNPEKKLCDAAENVSCNNMNDGTTSTNSPPSSSGNDFDNIVTDPATYCASLMPQQANDRIVYIGSSSSCSRYYICYYRQAIMQECSAELHWNSLTAKCDLPERAQCTLEQTIRPPSSNSNINSELIHCPTYGQHLYPYLKRSQLKD
ncbi:peritrophin-1 [Drosophila busckii]|uniref:peritrophin-1 n=1 Tax=Drosophila busckii TaxID=30019 RepID=UPI001432CB50|nr:peritrophin-1 [Drosophila busckii]